MCVCLLFVVTMLTVYGWTYGYQEYCFNISEPEEFDTSGVRAYVNECNRLGVIPVSFFKRHVHDNHFVMRNHGLGPLGAKAICKPLTVRCIQLVCFYSLKNCCIF